MWHGAGDWIGHLQRNNVDVIVTDHHEVVDEVPSAFAVLNPILEGYPFPGLSGCGIAFKFAQGIYQSLKIEPTPLWEYLDFVALCNSMGRCAYD